MLLQPGSGQSLLAFVLERKRAVGIVKNKAHTDFVMKNLVAAVRSLGLAPDKRPPKPVDLVADEPRLVRLQREGFAVPTAKGQLVDTVLDHQQL